MRVAVHHPARTEEVDGETVEVPESVAAFRLGRIEDFTNPLTGETTPKDEVAAHLLKEAQAEFPDLECKIEYLTNEEGGETSVWASTPPPEGSSPGGGVAAAQELHVEQAAAAGGGEPQ